MRIAASGTPSRANHNQGPDRVVVDVAEQHECEDEQNAGVGVTRAPEVLPERVVQVAWDAAEDLRQEARTTKGDERHQDKDDAGQPARLGGHRGCSYRYATVSYHDGTLAYDTVLCQEELAMTDHRPLNATAAALLGFLHDGPLTGYELAATAQRVISNSGR